MVSDDTCILYIDIEILCIKETNHHHYENIKYDENLMDIKYLMVSLYHIIITVTPICKS